jgi:hypothetical protein
MLAEMAARSGCLFPPANGSANNNGSTGIVLTPSANGFSLPTAVANLQGQVVLHDSDVSHISETPLSQQPCHMLGDMPHIVAPFYIPETPEVFDVGLPHFGAAASSALQERHFQPSALSPMASLAPTMELCTDMLTPLSVGEAPLQRDPSLSPINHILCPESDSSSDENWGEYMSPSRSRPWGGVPQLSSIDLGTIVPETPHDLLSGGGGSGGVMAMSLDLLLGSSTQHQHPAAAPPSSSSASSSLSSQPPSDVPSLLLVGSAPLVMCGSAPLVACGSSQQRAITTATPMESVSLIPQSMLQEQSMMLHDGNDSTSNNGSALGSVSLLPQRTLRCGLPYPPCLGPPVTLRESSSSHAGVQLSTDRKRALNLPIPDAKKKLVGLPLSTSFRAAA